MVAASGFTGAVSVRTGVTGGGGAGTGGAGGGDGSTVRAEPDPEPSVGSAGAVSPGCANATPAAAISVRAIAAQRIRADSSTIHARATTRDVHDLPVRPPRTVAEGNAYGSGRRGSLDSVD